MKLYRNKDYISRVISSKGNNNIITYKDICKNNFRDDIPHLIQNKRIIQCFFARINNINNQTKLANCINEYVPKSNIANGKQVVNDIVNGKGTYTIVNGRRLNHASAGNIQQTATAFYRYANRNTIIVLALGAHLTSQTYQLYYKHPGFLGNNGDNYIDLTKQ